MTENKPIMIDGVDVSECIFYQANFEEDFDVKIKHFCSNWYNSCESVNNNNCSFKQLARKTQECQQLINKNNRLEEELNTTKLLLEGKNNQYVAKTQECEELKREIAFGNNGALSDKIRAEVFKELNNENNQLKADNYELKKIIKRLDVPKHEVIDMDIALENEKLKSEKEQIKKYLGISSKTIMERLEELQEFRDRDRDKLYHAEQKLEKIKPILEYYTHSYIGVKQLDGTYKYELYNGNFIFYNPRKAKEGLKIIDEVE